MDPAVSAGGSMNIFWEALPYVKNFFQLNFLFSGLEVSSTMILAARLLMLTVLGGGLLWAMFKIIIKFLDCAQTFLANLGQIPWIFYVLLLMVIPVSADSLGAKWIGYILLISALLGFSLCAVLAMVAWKYGVDQALRFINRLRHPHPRSMPAPTRESCMPPDNVVGSFVD